MYRGFSIAVIEGEWVGVDHQREFVARSKEELFEAIDTALS